MKKKAKGKAKVNRKRSRTKDLGAKKAATVKGGVVLAGPTRVAYKIVDGSLANIKYIK